MSLLMPFLVPVLAGIVAVAVSVASIRCIKVYLGHAGALRSDLMQIDREMISRAETVNSQRLLVADLERSVATLPEKEEGLRAYYEALQALALAEGIATGAQPQPDLPASPGRAEGQEQGRSAHRDVNITVKRGAGQ